MKKGLAKEIAALERMSVGELQQRYAEVCGEQVRSRHKHYLVRRIAWRLQANAEGGLSDRALTRAEELADLADARTTPPKEHNLARRPVSTAKVNLDSFSDPRLPAPGTVLTRPYKGRLVAVTVRRDGFECEGERYRSLSAVAKAITGSHVNGFRFFALEGKS